MNLYITKSKTKNKKYDLLHTDKNVYYRLAIQDIKTTLCIRTTIEKKLFIQARKRRS